MASLIVIPIGLMCLFVGAPVVIGKLIFRGELDWDDVIMTFILFIYPYLATKHFIKTGHLLD